MTQILVRELSENVIVRLRQEAAREGVSMEEEVRRILERALLDTKPPESLKDYLLSIPPGDNDVFDRQRNLHRKVEL